MPRLAIVISAVDNFESMEGTLVSVLENRPADCEVIAALSQPYADPYDLKDEVRFVQASKRPTSITAIQAALAVTRAPFVHLLASGCEVSEGWADRALSRFGDRQVASVVPLVFDADVREQILAAGVGYNRGGRRVLVGQGQRELQAQTQAKVVGACGFAAFYRKAALDFVGGLSTQLGGRQADVDLALVLRRAGFEVALESESRVYARPSVDAAEGPFRQALHDERLFWRNISGSPLSAMTAHAGVVAFEVLRSLGRPRMFTQLAARLMACCQLPGYIRHQQALDQLGRRALRSRPAHEHVRIDRGHKVLGHSESARAQVPSH